MDKLLHTPEGVRDIYNAECERKTKLEESLKDVLSRYGFSNIQTPMFEFFDMYSKERGSVPSSEIYKFFDREGNILALRPDITPSVARCVAKYYKEETLPLRLSYCGDTFLNNSSYQGKLKEMTQIGAELIGDESVHADAEMIALTVECLKKAGLTRFQVEIGHAGFFKGLVQEANLSLEEMEQLRILIENKNMFGVEEVLSKRQMSKELKEVFLKLPELFGTVDKLMEVEACIHNETSIMALKRLEKLYELLRLYGFDGYITFDLGMLNQYEYYTGIIFKGYTYGTGDAIVSGGRYDGLLEQFGKKSSAIGMAVLLDSLLNALVRQRIAFEPDTSGTLFVYTEEFAETAIGLASRLRKNGMQIQLLMQPYVKELKEYLSYVRKIGIGGILILNEKEKVKVIHAEDGKMEKVSLNVFDRQC
ncbi:MAG: ATP phosphoribosyltransferase regulatory subunit [Lachnospiraceae bacterium]|nr:ATP phosphoribosyltransferase regulatory subunit [Lachnospiraceae bacterium]